MWDYHISAQHFHHPKKFLLLSPCIITPVPSTEPSITLTGKEMFTSCSSIITKPGLEEWVWS